MSKSKLVKNAVIHYMLLSEDQDSGEVVPQPYDNGDGTIKWILTKEEVEELAAVFVDEDFSNISILEVKQASFVIVKPVQAAVVVK